MQKRQRGDEKGEPDIDTDVVTQPYRLDLNPSVSSVNAAEIVDCPRTAELAKEKIRSTYASFFRGEMDFDYFCMLPIANEQRALFLQKLIQNQRVHPK